MSQFSNAQHLAIHGGTFNASIVHQDSRDSESGLHTLSLAVSHGAMHDSAERYPPPNCHPDTRIAVRQIILDWINDESSAFPFFWLYGPAGAGKTAILQAIAEFLSNLSESDATLGGSFFFSRGKHGRDKAHFLFSTIAYQLALKIPGLRQRVNYIVQQNPTLHTKSITVQLQTLIVDALRHLTPPPRRSYIVIIDGLDECENNSTQQSILSLLCESITAHKLPLRILIGSRQEAHIRATFDQPALYTITQRILLDEKFNPGRDIEVYLRDGFADIYAKNIDVLSHVEQPWPAKNTINLLVGRSSGQFIYAATVLRFVAADFFSPVKQLELVLMPNSTAFSNLDRLYTQILSVYPSQDCIVKVLGIIIGVASGLALLTPEMIADILEMEQDEVKVVLRGLSSLIGFVGDKKNEEYQTHRVVGFDKNSNIGGVYFLHASFRDYLVDSSRSGLFHVHPYEYQDRATVWGYAILTKWVRRSCMIPFTSQPSQKKFWRHLTNPLNSPLRVLRTPKLVKDAIVADIQGVGDPAQEIPSTTRLIPHSKTLVFLRTQLPLFFLGCPDTVKDKIMTDIEDLVKQFRKISSGGKVDFIAIGHLMALLEANLKIYINGFSINTSRCRDKFLRLFHGYQKMLDQFIISAFSKSNEMIDLLKLLPGIVVQKELTMQGMADLYEVKMDLLERVFKGALEPFFEVDQTRFSYMLKTYVSSFLQDRDRSHLYYCDPMAHHAFICRRFLSLADESNGSDVQSHDLLEYFQSKLYTHLYGATNNFPSGENIASDHPTLDILKVLERAKYYHLDTNRLCFKSHLTIHTIRPILRWTSELSDRLKDMTVPISVPNLIERIRHLTDDIYREILCIETRK